MMSCKQWLLTMRLAWMLLYVQLFSELDDIDILKEEHTNSTEGFYFFLVDIFVWLYSGLALGNVLVMHS